jgi:coenzyme F420-reducing hydrogenase delta subunit
MEKSGIRPERLQLEWISAAEGIRFAEVMHKIEAIRKTVTRKRSMRPCGSYPGWKEEAM